MFNLSPKWNFPSNNHSQIIGIADSGVEMLNDLATSGKFRIPRKREIFSNVP